VSQKVGDLMMKDKFAKLFMLAGIFFAVGALFLLLGANGEKNAIAFSRPWGASGWTTSESLINAFIYSPIIIAIYFFVLSIVTFTISLNNWQKK
jgi:hypothetical protein